MEDKLEWYYTIKWEIFITIFLMGTFFILFFILIQAPVLLVILIIYNMIIGTYIDSIKNNREYFYREKRNYRKSLKRFIE